MGINIPSMEELIAVQYKTIKEIAAKLQADSVEYLSVDGLKRAVKKGIYPNSPKKPNGHCTACLTGDYAVPIEI